MASLEKWTLTLQATFEGWALGPLGHDRYGQRYVLSLFVPHVGLFRIGFTDEDAVLRFDALYGRIFDMASDKVARDALLRLKGV